MFRACSAAAVKKTRKTKKQHKMRWEMRAKRLSAEGRAAHGGGAVVAPSALDQLVRVVGVVRNATALEQVCSNTIATR